MSVWRNSYKAGEQHARVKATVTTSNHIYKVTTLPTTVSFVPKISAF
jgi:hypothetical protein